MNYYHKLELIESTSTCPVRPAFRLKASLPANVGFSQQQKFTQRVAIDCKEPMSPKAAPF
jgi:hypothetical protein